MSVIIISSSSLQPMSGQRRGGGGPGASMGNRSSRATTTTTTTMTPPSPSPSSSVRDDATPRRGRGQGHGEDDTDESAIPPPFLERRDAAAVFERLYSSLWTTPSSSTSSSSVDLNDDPEGREAAPDDDDDEIDAIGRRLGGSRAPSSSNCEVEWTTPKVTSSPSLSTTSTTSMTMRTTTLLTEDEKRGARCAAISLFVACALLVGVLSSSWRAAVGPGSATGGRGGEAMPPSSNADEVIGGDGNDKFVIGEEEMALMEMEGDLYYYDDDDYDGNDHRDDDAAYYDGSEVDATSEAMAAAAQDEEDDPLLYNAYSTTIAQDAGDGPDTSEEVAGTGTGGGGGAIAAMITTAEASTAIRGVNDGGQCSVIRPVDYDSIHRRGTGYESFPGYQCYRTVDGTRSTVIDLIDKYPNLTSRVVLSDYPTAEMGESLRVLVITNKNKQTPIGKGKMMVVSSIHARELATSEAMTRFAEYLLQQYGIDPDVTWIVDFTEIHLIFHANPDGRQYLEMGGERTMWKKNRNKGDCANEAYGVDPNRNFPFKWGECVTTSDNRCSSSGDCSSVVYRGPSPMSEQETKAILSYAKTVFPSGQRKGSTVKIAEGRLTVPFAEDSEGVFIDVHSHGRDVGWPWGFVNQRTPNDAGLGALGRKFASFSGYSLWAPKMPNRVCKYPRHLLCDEQTSDYLNNAT